MLICSKGPVRVVCLTHSSQDANGEHNVMI